MLTFTPITQFAPGLLADLLYHSYEALLHSDGAHWEQERAQWQECDALPFANPDTVGACFFVSCLAEETIGFASYDPRPGPAYGVVGHNCILPAYRGKGFGKAQIGEILRRFKGMGFHKAVVSTGEHPFFAPARRMYEMCGFRELRRTTGGPDPRFRLVEYELELC